MHLPVWTICPMDQRKLRHYRQIVEAVLSVVGLAVECHGYGVPHVLFMIDAADGIAKARNIVMVKT